MNCMQHRDFSSRPFSVPLQFDAMSCFAQQDGGNDDLGCKLDEETSRHPNGTASAATFPLERHINIATRMLALDPNLAKIHARLIAKMPEETFWYHYFSRIETLREDVGLEQLCEDLPQVRGNGHDMLLSAKVIRRHDSHRTFEHGENFARAHWSFVGYLMNHM